MFRRAAPGCSIVLAVGLSAASAWPQTAGRPPDLAVTRLQGTKPAGAPPASAAGKPPVTVSPLPVTELDDRQTVASLDGPRRITLSVSRPMPIGDLLLLLVNDTPFSLVTDNDASGTFTGDLKELTMRQALEAVLFPRRLDYDVQGTLVRVFPRRTSTRLFTINYPNVRRTLARGFTNRAAAGSPSAPATQLSTASSADVYDEIERGVQSLLSPSGLVHVDRTAGLVDVTDFAERLDQVGVYLEALQLRAMRQVRIDAQVLSIEFLPDHAVSIDWTSPAITSATAVRSSSGYGPGGLSVTNLEALTKAFAEQGVVTKIATPHIVAMNNEPAVVRIGRELVFFEDADVASPRREKRTQRPATALEGLTLTLVAQVSADDFVQLHVSPAFSTHSGESKMRDGFAVPILAVNQADTLMRVRDGETIVLSGFLNAEERSASRSGFTRLFAGPSRITVRSEVVVLLTPRILKAVVSPN